MIPTSSLVELAIWFWIVGAGGLLWRRRRPGVPLTGSDWLAAAVQGLIFPIGIVVMLWLYEMKRHHP